MTIRKHNEFLEADGGSASDNDTGYDSEAADAYRGRSSIVKPSRAAKRRRTSSASTSAPSDDDSVEYWNKEVDAEHVGEDESISLARAQSNATDLDQLHSVSEYSPASKDKIPKPGLQKKKEGVLYLSRVPPHLKPSALRTVLSPFGSITNLYLTPTPPSQRARQSTSTRKSFSSGWIAFARRSAAKGCVAALNGTTLVAAGLARGKGRKGGYYGDDVWNLRYLKGFTWDDLMEGVRREGREREEKVRMGIARERRERKTFLDAVERGKVERGREEKRVKKAEKSGQDGGDIGADGKKRSQMEGQMRFRQNRVKGGRQGEGHDQKAGKILRNIF